MAHEIKFFSHFENFEKMLKKMTVFIHQLRHRKLPQNFENRQPIYCYTM